MRRFTQVVGIVVEGMVPEMVLQGDVNNPMKGMMTDLAGMKDKYKVEDAVDCE